MRWLENRYEVSVARELIIPINQYRLHLTVWVPSGLTSTVM